MQKKNKNNILAIRKKILNNDKGKYNWNIQCII
jgi:hypothetical protein